MVEKAAEPRTLFVAADVAAAAVADVARIMMTDKQRHCKDYELVVEEGGSAWVCSDGGRATKSTIAK